MHILRICKNMHIQNIILLENSDFFEKNSIFFKNQKQKTFVPTFLHNFKLQGSTHSVETRATSLLVSWRQPPSKILWQKTINFFSTHICRFLSTFLHLWYKLYRATTHIHVPLRNNYFCIPYTAFSPSSEENLPSSSR